MSPKQRLASLIQTIGRLPGINAVLYQPRLRAKIQRWPGLKILYGAGWSLLHPFDSRHGTDTSGFVPSDELPSSPFDATRNHVYAGSQPSIIRAALAKLPPLESFAFIDLGCGKGRPLLVATEFPFRDLIGVELSANLAADARKNAAIFQQRFPSRRPVRVETGDASAFLYPAGNLVVFLYNPFGAEVVAKVVSGIEAALAHENRALCVVYYNPVHAACFDGSPILRRYFAATLPYAPEERGFGPDETDTVVIWQGAVAATSSLPGSDAQVVVLRSARAELAR